MRGMRLGSPGGVETGLPISCTSLRTIPLRAFRCNTRLQHEYKGCLLDLYNGIVEVSRMTEIGGVDVARLFPPL
jgi:hypothetical protein